MEKSLAAHQGGCLLIEVVLYSRDYYYYVMQINILLYVNSVWLSLPYWSATTPRKAFAGFSA